jgi:hypothetical protein
MGIEFSYGPSLVILVLGIFLLLIAIVGGGLEIKEIKIPKIERTPRVLTALLGGMLMVCGASVGAISFMSSFLSSSPEAMSAPTQISGNYTPNIQYIEANKIQLPAEPGISEDVQKEVAALIVDADKAEILANFYQNDAYLTSYYAGYALQQMQQNIEMIRQSGYIELDDLDLGSSYYVKMYLNNNVLLIDECEYWKTYLYDPSTGELLNETEWTIVPQTISIELIGDQPYITTISFYQNNAFCTK